MTREGEPSMTSREKAPVTPARLPAANNTTPPPAVILPVPGEGPLTMTSREIAELTGKAHKNVLRDVKRMLEDLEIDGLKYEPVTYRDEKNEERPEYRLPKDLTICLVAGYDAKLRLSIIRRWEELEMAAKPADVPGAGPSAGAIMARLGDLEAAVMSLTQAIAGGRHPALCALFGAAFPAFVLW